MKKYYTILLEVGLVLSLLIFLILFNYDFTTDSDNVIQTYTEQQTVKMEEIIQTEQIKSPPPPPRPVVPMVVPNNEIIEDEIIDFMSDLDLELDAPLYIPTPPMKYIEEDEEEDEIFVIVEQMPELNGGMLAVSKLIKYPEIAIIAGIEGRVVVKFIIDEKGKTSNHQILRGIGGGCDEEAVRVIKELTFTPGRQRGIPVKVSYSMPIIFKIRK